MKKNTALLSALLTFLPWTARSAEKIRVVATMPDLADITRRVSGDLVVVETIARGTEDIHQVVMRPSFVTKLNRAAAVVYLGLTIEHSFLLGLLDVASNPRMQSDPVRGCMGLGCIDCSEGVRVLEKPETMSRAEGEIHPYGNPHYNVGPDNGALIARNIADGLSTLFPQHREQFQKNLKTYTTELDAKLAVWRKWVEPLRGVKAVSYHKDIAYLGQFTGIQFVDALELKPGIAPTPTHMKELVQTMKAQNIKLIVREQQYERKTCEWLAEQTGAKIAVIGTMANAFPDTETFIKFSEHNLKALLIATGKGPT